MAVGGQAGNNNAGKGKPWRDALDWALRNHSSNTGKKVSKVEESQALRTIATKCVDDAIAGDKDARKEIGDRLEGKPSQSVELGTDPENPLVLMIKEISGSTLEPRND